MSKFFRWLTTATLISCPLTVSAQSLPKQVCNNQSIVFRNLEIRQKLCPIKAGSAQDLKVPLKDIDITIINDLANQHTLNAIFAKHTDSLFNWELPTEVHSLTTEPIVSRSLPWGYPDDGCATRSQLFTQYIRQSVKQHLLQIYAFSTDGDPLRAHTNNHPDGYVEWWYHVAPITRVGNVAYVIDPALSPNAPMSLSHWIDALNYQKPAAMKNTIRFAICDSNAAYPSSACYGAPASSIEPLSVTSLLFREWQRKHELGDSPTQVMTTLVKPVVRSNSSEAKQLLFGQQALRPHDPLASDEVLLNEYKLSLIQLNKVMLQTRQIVRAFKGFILSQNERRLNKLNGLDN